MIDRIRTLERASAVLDPGAVERAALSRAAIDHAEAFYRWLETAPASSSPEEDGRGLCDSPISPEPIAMHEALALIERNVDRTGQNTASAGFLAYIPGGNLYHSAIGDFLAAVRALRPTAIIGVAGVGGTFTQQVVEEMAAINARPMVFALSNPTSQSECTAEQAYRWSGGRALFACGSPFDPVTVGGHTHVPRQGNNSYIFPGVGLGVIATRSTRVTDAMFMAAARSLAAQVTDLDLAQGSLYPPLAKVREVSAHIATAVAEVAYAQDLATVPRPDNLMEFVKSKMYDPLYESYV